MHTDHIYIDIQQQRLSLIKQGVVVFSRLISSALKGVGEQNGSGQTPRGLFKVRIKVGAAAAVNSVFIGRRFSQEIYHTQLAIDYPKRDWILSRILWLTGMESGHNRGGNVDTLRRYIYLHGCPDSCEMGIALSHGCIRMRNQDIIELFDNIDSGILVCIA